MAIIRALNPAPRRAAATVDQILAAAEREFAERGFSGTRLQDIADAVGIQKPSLFYHFANKDELYKAVVLAVLEPFESLVSSIVSAENEPIERRLIRLIEGIIEVLAEHRHRAKFMLRALMAEPEVGESDDLTGHIVGLLAGLTRFLKAGMRAGVIRMMSAANLLQSIIGLTIYHFASDEFGTLLTGKSLFLPASVKRRQQEVVDLLLRGVLIEYPKLREV